MRRISSLFRSKHNDAHSSPPQPLVIPSAPSTPVLTASSNPSHSSASSSGSASVRTPDDDPNTRIHHKKSWLVAWLSSKRSGTHKRSAQHDDPPLRSDFVHPPNPRVARAPLRNAHDTDDDDLSEESEDDDDDDNSHQNDNPHPPPLALPYAPTAPALEKSRKYLEAITTNSLSPSPSSTPLYHHPGTHIFPRSINVSRLLSHPSSLRVSMLKSHLLRTLQHSPDLSSIDAGLLSTFRTRPPPLSVHRELTSIDVHAVDSTRTSQASHGLKRWITRPCFEDRFTMWLPSPDSSTLISRPVSADYAVAQLEFTEAIEILAGLDFPPSSPDADFNPLLQTNTYEELPETLSPSASSSSSSSSSLSAPSIPRNPQYKAVPSPLRIQHGPTTSPTSSVAPGNDSSSQLPTTTPAVDSDTQPPPIKREVRFAEDDKDDQIPLAYVLRSKKKREEKARFLREERERRAFEEERRKQEMERMERERERREWERERKMWDMEKQAMEEERKARLYAEEIAASRLRRESARYGLHSQSVTAPSSPLLSPREPEDRRGHESRNYSRPAYDLQRRQASEPSTTSLDPGFRIASSRPSSVGHGGPSPSGSGSRPPSLYSANTLSSSEDGRFRDAVAAANGSIRSQKRASVGSMSSQRAPSEQRTSSYSGCYDPIPPVPPVPRPYEIDAPLLPPTPPFMMQQISRPRSSHSSSSGSSKQKISRPGSTDTFQSRRSNVSASPHRERVSDRRRASGEDPAPSLSERGRTNVHSQSQPNLYSRSPGIHIGMSSSPIPTYFYPQSPWTGVPTIAQLQQQAPMAMAMAYNVRPPFGHRPPTIS